MLLLILRNYKKIMHTKEEKMAAFGRLLDIMDELRTHCPWNAAQTMESIRPMTEEEVYELSDAVLRDDPSDISKEIGDLMYHLVFYSKIGEEQGRFDVADAINSECEKMEFRHPHVFGPEKGRQTSAEEIADTWELVKSREKGGNKTVMSGIPDSMPAMLKAMSMQEKARGCGFDWEKAEDVWEKVEEETEEVREVCAEDSARTEEEFGDLLFAVINAARLYGVDAEKALNTACTKFRRRFSYVEEALRRSGRGFGESSLEEMDALWEEAKSGAL